MSLFLLGQLALFTHEMVIDHGHEAEVECELCASTASLEQDVQTNRATASASTSNDAVIFSTSLNQTKAHWLAAPARAPPLT